jgi:SAM-dependent methyltransferase
MANLRGEQLARLTYIKTSLNDPYYLEYKYLFADLKNAVQKYASGDVLDIGCGNKPYYTFFEGRNSSYIGCDVVQSSHNIVDVICLATEIPLADNSKDTVFTTQVIEHVADHRKLLSEAFRILKPGGNLIVSGPMCWEHHEEPYDFFRFTKYGFDYILKEAGFETLEIKANGGKWALVGQVFLNSIRASFKKKSFKRKFIKALYFIFRIKWIVNIFFGWLDKADKDYSATLNFVVVAKKPL